MSAVEVVLAADADLAEGCVWDDRANVLWWIDIFRGEIHRLDPSTGGDAVWTVDGPVGSLALREQGGLLIARRDGVYAFSPGEEPAALVRPEPGRRHNRFNDGRTDRQGRFWVGSLHLDETEPTGGFYRIDPDHSATLAADGIYAANGTAFSLDGRTGYHADSRRRVVWRFDCDPATGALANRRVFVEIAAREGAPTARPSIGTGATGWPMRAAGASSAMTRRAGSIASSSCRSRSRLASPSAGKTAARCSSPRHAIRWIPRRLRSSRSPAASSPWRSARAACRIRDLLAERPFNTRMKS